MTDHAATVRDALNVVWAQDASAPPIDGPIHYPEET